MKKVNVLITILGLSLFGSNLIAGESEETVTTETEKQSSPTILGTESVGEGTMLGLDIAEKQVAKTLAGVKATIKNNVGPEVSLTAYYRKVNGQKGDMSGKTVTIESEKTATFNDVDPKKGFDCFVITMRLYRSDPKRPGNPPREETVKDVVYIASPEVLETVYNIAILESEPDTIYRYKDTSLQGKTKLEIETGLTTWFDVSRLWFDI